MTVAERLSARLGERLRHLGTDVDLEHFGDPHVAFIAFVYPDREPEIVAVTDRTAQSLRHLRFGKKDEPQDSKGRFFDYNDFKLAELAFNDADLGFIIAKDDGREELGETIQRRMSESWANRIANKIKAALTKADADAARPAVCPNCKRRFTERGINTHWARSYCGQAMEASK